jgi:hypothetical protein
MSMPDATNNQGTQNQLHPSSDTKVKKECDLDFWRLLFSYILVLTGIGVVVLLVFCTNTANQQFMTVGISAIVGLIGFLAGHTSANVGKERSEQRLLEATQKKY